DERRLARAAHADDAVDLALFDLQTHAAEGHDLAPRHGIDLFQVPQFDQWLRHELFILSRSTQKPLRMIAKRQRSTDSSANIRHHKITREGSLRAWTFAWQTASSPDPPS